MNLQIGLGSQPADLAQIETEQIAKIKSLVAAIVPPPAVGTTIDQLVTVTTLPQLPAQRVICRRTRMMQQAEIISALHNFMAPAQVPEIIPVGPVQGPAEY